MEMNTYAGLSIILFWAFLFVWVGLACKKISPLNEIKAFLKKQSTAGRIVFLLFFLVMTIYGGTKPTDGSSTNDVNNVSGSTNMSADASLGQMHTGQIDGETKLENILNSEQSQSTSENNLFQLIPNDFSNTQKSIGFALAGITTNKIHDFSIPANGVIFEDWLKYGAADDVFIFEQINPIITYGTNIHHTARVYSQGAIAFGTNLVVNVFDTILGIPPTNNWSVAEEPMLWYNEKTSSVVYTWHDVLLNRSSDENISFQVEITKYGDIVSHYDNRVTEYIKNLTNLDYGIAISSNLTEEIAINNTCSVTNHTCATLFESTPNGGIIASHLCEIVKSLNGGFSLYWKNISDLKQFDEDNDGLSNFKEICIYKSNYLYADTDGDNLNDAYELHNGYSPIDADENNDGIPDGANPNEWLTHPLWSKDNTPSVVISLNTPISSGVSASLMLNDLTIPLSETNSWGIALPTGELVNVRLQSTSHEPIDLHLDIPSNITRIGGSNTPIIVIDNDKIFEGEAANAQAQIIQPTYEVFVDGVKIENNYCAHSDEIYFDVVVYPSELNIDFSRPMYIDGWEHISGNRFKASCPSNNGEGFYCHASYDDQVDYGRFDIWVNYHKCSLMLDGKCYYEECSYSKDFEFNIDKSNIVMLRSQNDLVKLQATHSLSKTTDINWEITPQNSDGAKLHLYNSSNNGSNNIYLNDTIYVSAGDLLGEYLITARLNDYPEIFATSTLKVIDVFCEPICNEIDQDYGIINPAYVVNGMDSMFKAWIEPKSIVTNSGINAQWVTSNSNITVVSNSLEKLIVRGNGLGECSLTLNIDNAQFVTPKIDTKVVNMVTNTIHVCYNYSTIDAVDDIDTLRLDFESRLHGVNKIFKQVGIFFELGVVTNQVNKKWVKILYENSRWNIDKKMYDILHNNRGIQIFVVDDIFNANALHTAGHIIIKRDARESTIAHEIGHACKLPDIYIVKNNLIVEEYISKSLISNDCTGIDEYHFYKHEKQNKIIPYLLMFGVKNDTKVDISYGNVFGVWYKWENGMRYYMKSNAEIGFEDNGIRNLSIYGGNN